MLKITFKTSNGRKHTKIFLKNTTDQKYGMILDSFEEIVDCMMGYSDFYYTPYEALLDAVKDAAVDIAIGRRSYFKDNLELFTYIAENYI